MTLRDELNTAVAAIRNALPATAKPTVGLILGSGLGSFADKLAGRTAIPFDRLPGFPASTIVGHAGNLVYGRGGEGAATPATVEVLAMQGRVHFYEGHEMARVAFPARAMIAAGCKTLIITNAAGGIDPALKAGEIVILRDHLNLLPVSPLRGPNDESIGPRFPDMSEVYDGRLRQIAEKAGAELGWTLRQGVYAALPGPAYETPAEVRMLRVLGADMVGMSTVPEAIVAMHMGARVLGLSCVTNLAAGLTPNKLSHTEVTETAARVRDQFERLLARILAKLALPEA
jgi:purine-nucleoside phosphorylase